MSHELRTPAERHHRRIQPAAAGAMSARTTVSHLEILKFSSEHMMILINEILDFNKIESGTVRAGEPAGQHEGFPEGSWKRNFPSRRMPKGCCSWLI
jgi:signal transduction histidine kinase